MAFDLPQRRQAIRQIQTQKRNIPIEQIIAVRGQNPMAQGIEVAGNLIGQALQQRASSRRQGEELAKLEVLAGQPEGSFQGLDPSTATTLAMQQIKNKQKTETPDPSGYFIPRGVDPKTNRPVYSSSKKPGLFYDDMTPFSGGAPGKLTLQTMPSEQVEKETQIETLKLAADKIKSSYDPSFVGPIASKVGKGKQYVEGLATPKAATFYGNISDLRNQLVYLRSGKQINEEEYKRLLDAMPNEGRSSTDFETKLGNFNQLLDTIISSRKNNLEGTGYRTLNKIGGSPVTINNDPLGLR